MTQPKTGARTPSASGRAGWPLVFILGICLALVCWTNRSKILGESPELVGEASSKVNTVSELPANAGGEERSARIVEPDTALPVLDDQLDNSTSATDGFISSVIRDRSGRALADVEATLRPDSRRVVSDARGRLLLSNQELADLMEHGPVEMKGAVFLGAHLLLPIADGEPGALIKAKQVGELRLVIEPAAGQEALPSGREVLSASVVPLHDRFRGSADVSSPFVRPIPSSGAVTFPLGIGRYAVSVRGELGDDVLRASMGGNNGFVAGNVTVQQGEVSELVLKLPLLHRVEIRAVNSVTRAPVPSAHLVPISEVEATAPGGPGLIADAQGVVVAWMRAGSAMFAVSAPGYPAQNIVMRETGADSYEIDLCPFGAGTRLVVSTPNFMNREADLAVSLVPLGGSPEPQAGDPVEAGFAFADVPPGAYVLQIQMKDLLLSVHHRVTGELPVDSIDLTQLRVLPVQLRIDSVQLPELDVTARSRASGAGTGFFADTVMRPRNGAFVGRVCLAAESSSFDTLLVKVSGARGAGAYSLRLESTSLEPKVPSATSSSPLTLASFETQAVRVTGANGAPLSGVRIDAMMYSTEFRGGVIGTCRTDEAGVAQLLCIDTRLGVIRAFGHPGCNTAEAPLSGAQGEPSIIELSTCGAPNPVAIQLRRPSGELLRGFLVKLIPAADVGTNRTTYEDADLMAYSGPQGIAHFPSVAPGDYAVTLTGGKGRAGPEAVYYEDRILTVEPSPGLIELTILSNE